MLEIVKGNRDKDVYSKIRLSDTFGKSIIVRCEDEFDTVCIALNKVEALEVASYIFNTFGENKGDC